MTWRKRLLIALAVVVLAAPVAAIGTTGNSAQTPASMAPSEGFIIQADYVGPLFEGGRIPTIQEGDAFQTVVGNSQTGTFEVVWEVNGEDGLPAPLTTEQQDQIRAQVGELLGGTGNGVLADGHTPDYSCGIHVSRPIVTEGDVETTSEGTCWLPDDEEDVTLKHRVWGIPA